MSKLVTRDLVRRRMKEGRKIKMTRRMKMKKTVMMTMT
jgi:hypothetical protein